MRLLIRSIMASLIAGMVGVAMVPVFVLRDLNSGGTGWGLCDGGLSGCTNSHFAGFELLGVVLVATAALVWLYRVALKALRWTEHHYDRGRSVAIVAGYATPKTIDTTVDVPDNRQTHPALEGDNQAILS
jgi:hypothetical protein